MTRLTTALLTLLCLLCLPLTAVANDALARWQPNFDPSGAEYTYLVSNVSHPGIEGVGVGFRIRDRVWQESGGRLYVDFRPLSQLGGEKDVLNKLKMGAIQGMLCSSVAAANLAPLLGIVNLPFVVDSFDKLDRFRATPELFEPFSNCALPAGVRVLDITGYGPYGWATTTPVRTLDEAASVRFRIAEAPVNADIYKAWGLKFTALPWPDVPQALQTGVINGLDHSPIVCNITKKFDVARHFTEVNYAQGLFVHLVNERWLQRLPEDLRAILLRVVAEESADTRQRTRIQYDEQVAAAKAAGVQFYPLSAAQQQTLVELAAPVYKRWEERIGADYLAKARQLLAP
ncbi:MAG: TRAP transporter substrate-binding protein [Desulfuromonas sp.]|uniref:TRAP transporter substrate-binding protein n=1 Tax=Desulfuromonas thiophila TaxID=57664 RepID=UPI0024A95A79|nr:TRAP transporter substrate-binding protein [Desulfuromonas thiophila]MDD3802617.1 TRAP transporter substrate-binding protein [Desulfuromonas thiophila]MDY0398390.1 TRAP transporter substrate-binding protein [Desulfuromonas thiophila]